MDCIRVCCVQITSSPIIGKHHLFTPVWWSVVRLTATATPRSAVRYVSPDVMHFGFRVHFFGAIPHAYFRLQYKTILRIEEDPSKRTSNVTWLFEKRLIVITSLGMTMKPIFEPHDNLWLLDLECEEAHTPSRVQLDIKMKFVSFVAIDPQYMLNEVAPWDLGPLERI